VGCYIWYSDEGTGRGPSPPRPLLAVPNVTAHPSTASEPITVLLYNGPLLCGFNVPTKGLNYVDINHCMIKCRYSVHRQSRRCDYPTSVTTGRRGYCFTARHALNLCVPQMVRFTLVTIKMFHNGHRLPISKSGFPCCVMRCRFSCC